MLPDVLCSCLLYTSDAADEEDSVDLCGRRIIKKTKNKKQKKRKKKNKKQNNSTPTNISQDK